MTCCLVDDVENADEDDLFIFIVNPPLKIVDGKYLLEEEEEKEAKEKEAKAKAKAEKKAAAAAAGEPEVDCGEMFSYKH